MHDWITSDPEILGGKPCVRGTRVSVQHILELLASGGSREDVLKAYPQVTAEALNAALQYAAQAMKNDVVWDTKISA